VAHQRPGRSRQRGERTDLFTYDKADSDEDDLLSYVEIGTCWRSSSRWRLQRSAEPTRPHGALSVRAAGSGSRSKNAEDGLGRSREAPAG